MKHLLDAGLLHGDCLTVTGKTVAENLAELDPPAPDGAVVHPLSAPLHPVGGLAILTGSLAPKGSVVKVAGIDFDRFDGPARVFDGEDAAMEAILAGSINPGEVVVIRYEGPEGRSGDARDARRHRRDEGRGRGGDCASSPTGGSPAAPTGSASATSRPRPSTVGRSRSCATATASSSTRSPTPSTSTSRGRARAPPRRLEGPRAPLHHRRAGQVRPPGPRRRARRHHRSVK